MVLEQNAVDDPEQRGGEADTEGQGTDRGRSERRLALQLPDAERDVAEHTSRYGRAGQTFDRR